MSSITQYNFNEQIGDCKDLTGVPRLVLMRVIRPDRLPFALSEFVKTTLGDVFVSQSPFNMASTYKYTTAQTPVLFGELQAPRVTHRIFIL